ncbi:hypothetical protein OSB04_031874 [Centaurea solstitialis]|uniref:Uncharacterized protein n=1 Tax=Centaurea solstitialis TaxID=347529 RepID=A0AA38SMH9_9ASTR|nr:hypothetical protein OSB04_031874 [Centaurea solstitialis]
MSVNTKPNISPFPILNDTIDSSAVNWFAFFSNIRSTQLGEISTKLLTKMESVTAKSSGEENPATSKKLRGRLVGGIEQSGMGMIMKTAITDEEMLEKTFSTFHASNMLLQQQYRERGFKKYCDLISCLLVAKQNNELLMKNHETRPTGIAPFPEANVATYND